MRLENKVINTVAVASSIVAATYLITLNVSDNPYALPVIINATLFLGSLFAQGRHHSSIAPVTLALITAVCYLAVFKLHGGTYLYPESVDAILYQDLAREVVEAGTLFPLITSELSLDDYMVIFYILPFYMLVDSALPIYIANVLLLYFAARKLMSLFNEYSDALHRKFLRLLPLNPLFLYAALTGFKEALLVWATAGLFLSINKLKIPRASGYLLVILGLRPTVGIIVISGFLIVHLGKTIRSLLVENKIQKLSLFIWFFGLFFVLLAYPAVLSMAERSLFLVESRYATESALQQFSLRTAMILSLLSAWFGPFLSAFQSSSLMATMYGAGAAFHLIFVISALTKFIFARRHSRPFLAIDWPVLIILSCAVLGIGSSLRGFDPRFMLSFYALYPFLFRFIPRQLTPAAGG